MFRFGDCTERWSFFHELKRLGDSDSLDPPKSSSSSVILDPVSVKLEAIEAEDELEMKPIIKIIPEHIIKSRSQLSYKFDLLVWVVGHQRNSQETYCYCGQSGDWYKRMLQCKVILPP